MDEEFSLKNWIVGVIFTVLASVFSYLAYDFFQGLKDDAGKLKEQQVTIITELAKADERDARFFALHNSNTVNQERLEEDIEHIKTKQDTLLMAMNDVENTLLTSVAMKREVEPIDNRLSKVETKIELYHNDK